ncbi:MAG: FG-GAP-like repeat-containing protein [Gammaproteobacteria bacterium]|nr:FG-GAP-like repeat-containing protein [Gammaproteobacteria bacterium]
MNNLKGHEPSGEETGGLSLVDIDNDGKLELYVTHGRSETGRLFSYDGERFVRVAGNRGIEPVNIDRAGYFIDLDQDGWRDFVSIHATGVDTFRNDGTGSFSLATNLFGIQEKKTTHSMAAGDYDGDGDLDLLFTHWGPLWNDLRPPSGYLWRNDGGGRYEDVSHIMQIRPAVPPTSTAEHEMSFTPVFADIDADGDSDLLLASDFGASQVLQNDAGIGFVETNRAVLTDENGMGGAVADYDRDGDLDWFVSSIFDADNSHGFGGTGNRLYRNINGTGQFEDATEETGVREGGWGWGSCFSDFDNDGHPDLFQTNGYFSVSSQRITEGPKNVDEPDEFAEFIQDRSRLFMSNGDGTFSERGTEFGIDHTGQGRGVVCADYDDDGRVDIFIANHGLAPTVYSNNIKNDYHYLKISLAGQRPNPHGIGAQVTLRTTSGKQLQEMQLGASYLSQAPSILHFGLGPDQEAVSIQVKWPAPGNQITRLYNVPADQHLRIHQPAFEGVLLSVVQGSGSGIHAPGARIAIEAATAHQNYRFSHWTSEADGRFEDARSPRTTFTMPADPVTIHAHFLPGPPPSREGISVARLWIEVMLQAIRDDEARPTVHARNLFHLSAAMYDAWAAYSELARPYLLSTTDSRCIPPAFSSSAELRSAREKTISHAAYRLIRHRFQFSPNARKIWKNTDSLMSALNYAANDDFTGATGVSPESLGQCIGEHYISHGLADGSNEANQYGITDYQAVNPALELSLPGNPEILDLDRWQPLRFPKYVDQSGVVITDFPEFVTPEWGRVKPFALTEDDKDIYQRDGTEYHVYYDPGPPPAASGPLSDLYKWGFALVARWSSYLSTEDSEWINIAPSGLGNILSYPQEFEQYPDFYDAMIEGPGHALNPATGKPYDPQWVPRADYVRVLAEFWADGPESETPPGHWFVILNAVNDHDQHIRRFEGQGAELDPLEWDIKAYFTLGGAMHDAAIASWSIKGWYDYIRPISALRAMADRGQSSNPALPAYSSDGLPLAEGLIELVVPTDPLAGENQEHVDKIKLLGIMHLTKYRCPPKMCQCVSCLFMAVYVLPPSLWGF